MAIPVTNTVSYSSSASLASFYRNGIANGTASAHPGTLNAGLTVGSAAYYAGYYGWNGDIAEVIIYDRVLTDTERRNVENYLATKYEIPPVVSSSSTVAGTDGETFSYTVTASGSPTGYSATGLPTGLSINTTTGVISGTPTQTGTFTVTIGASNAGGSGTSTLTLTVYAADPPVITSATAVSSLEDHSFTYQITAANVPTSFNATGLPAGLSINTSTGAITGTPTAEGVSTITISATNTWGTGTATLILSVDPNVPVTTGLTAWYQAGRGVVTSGTSVTQWQDQSGHSYDIAHGAGTQAPTLGTDSATGQPVVAFNGSQYLSTNTQMAGANDVTVFTVASVTNPAATGVGTQIVVGNAYATTSCRVIGYENGHQIYGNGTTNGPGGAVTSNSQLQITTASFDQSTGLASFYAQGLANGTATISSGSLNTGLTVGSVLNYIPWNAWNGNIAEIIVYNSVLTSTEREEVEAYLAKKYGVYAPEAEWISSYSMAVQGEIERNHWSKAQADAYVSLQSSHPSMLTDGLKLWLKADTGVTQSSGHVTSWADQTGNYTVTQANSTNQPTLITTESTGGAGVRFSGTQWLSNISGMGVGLDQDSTIITVATTTTPGTNQYMAYFGNQSGTSSRSLGYINSSQAYDVGSGSYVTGTTAQANKWGVEAATIDSSGAQVSFTRDGFATGTVNLPQAGLAVTSGIAIGAGCQGGSPFIGDISEVLVYDHKLSDLEMKQVRIYLGDKYGFFVNDATWMQAYSFSVQLEIARNHWNKQQTDTYVAFQTSHSGMMTDGLLAWLKADNGVTTSGSAVTGWVDQTGNYSVAQGDSTKRPTLVTNAINGKPMVRFNGAQFLANTNSWGNSLSEDATIISVGMTTLPGYQQYSAWLGGTTTSTCRALGYAGGKQFFDTANLYRSGLAAPRSGVYGMEVATLNQARTDLAFLRNGLQTATGTFSSSLPNVASGFALGAQSGGGYGWYGDIGEVLIYDHQLNEIELRQVSGYLADKYGFYHAAATWPLTYSAEVQAEIVAHQWSKAQANAYVGVIQVLPVGSGLVAWYKADSGVTQTSGAVSTWRDSGVYQQDITQAAAAARPTMTTDTASGQPAVSFNGSQFLGNGNDFSNVVDMTVVTVAAAPTPTDYALHTQFSMGFTYGARGSRSLLYDNYTGKASVCTGYVYDFKLTAGGTFPATTALVSNAFTLKADTGVVNFFSHGVSSGSNTILTAPITNGIGLGSFTYYANSCNWKGTIAEVLVYNRVLTAAEMQQVQVYLAHKYALIPVIIRRLTSSTDVIGMVSSFGYDEDGILHTLTTPYGVSTLDQSVSPTVRWAEITNPLGQKQRIEYQLQNPNVSATEPLVPEDLSTYNADLDRNNT